MCNKADNSCRQEKLGCKGCFYNICKDKIKEKLINDIKGINEKLYSKEYINLYRTYRLKGMKTKCKELLEFLESEE